MVHTLRRSTRTPRPEVTSDMGPRRRVPWGESLRRFLCPGERDSWPDTKGLCSGRIDLARISMVRSVDTLRQHAEGQLMDLSLALSRLIWLNE